MSAPLTSDGLANDCRHDSASGVDTTPLSDPGKVWACDHCGFRWRQNGAGERVAPLTTRDALAAALGDAWRSGLPFLPDGGVDLAAFADALLASGALTDAGKLAEDEALVEARAAMLREVAAEDDRQYAGGSMHGLGAHEGAEMGWDAFAAALSAQSERAEVER